MVPKREQKQYQLVKLGFKVRKDIARRAFMSYYFLVRILFNISVDLSILRITLKQKIYFDITKIMTLTGKRPT